MGYYLLDNPPATQQFYPSRANKLTGGVLIHTTESIMDSVGPDTGAENVADFIRRRSDYGSYHVIVDSDSAVALMPDSYTAYHCAANGYNSRTWGISFACRTSDLSPDSEWTKRAMKNAAREIVAFWQRNGFDPKASARFIPAIQTQSSPGMSTHGEAQPADRSDAWTRHPRRAQLEALLLTEMAKLNGPGTTDPEEDEMKSVIVRDPRSGTMWHVCGNTRYKLFAQSEVDALRFLGVALVTEGGDGLVQWLRACKDLGRDK